MSKKCILLALVSVLTLMSFTACSSSSLFKSTRPDDFESDEVQFISPNEGDMIAVFDTSFGEIRAILYPQYAPMAVENFTTLAKRGYFDGLTFHRVVKDFIIQSGDPTGTGTGGESIWSGGFSNEFSDKLHHYSGALSMANQDTDKVTATNTSQFFIVSSPSDSVPSDSATQMADAGLREAVIDAYKSVGGTPYLDNLNTVFGQVFSGMDIVDQISNVEVNSDNKPVEDIVVNSVTITTFTPAE